MYKAPYDEKNAADYKKLSDSIAAALKAMEEDPRIPATEKELARLTGCSRGTLRNRSYPLERLKQIKASRNISQHNKAQREQPPCLTAAQADAGKESVLRDQLRNSRDEVAVWVYKYKDLENEANRLRRANEMLQAENAALSARNQNLLSRLEKAEGIQATTRVTDKVIRFRNGSNGRGKK